MLLLLKISNEKGSVFVAAGINNDVCGYVIKVLTNTFVWLFLWT